MPKRSKDELLAALRGVLGENQTDEAIALIEDVTDTFDAPTEDWEQKYKDNDAAWRKKYTDRFFSSGDVDQGSGSNTETVINSDEEQKPLTYDDLFKEG